MIVPYKTDPAAVVIPRWVQLGRVWITQTSLLDPAPAGPGLAHLTTDELLAIAADLGARLPTRAEILALHEVARAAGTELEVYTLPDAHLRAQGCVPGDARMASREWCERHDANRLAAIAALGDIGDAPVANDGKHFHGSDDGGPPPPGLCGIMGWWVSDLRAYSSTRHGPGFVQAGDGWPHGRNDARDYATTSKLVMDTAP